MDELNRLSAVAAAERIAQRAITSEALVRACLERIEARDGALGAFVHLDPERAIAEARARDKAPATGPLHGVPIGVKDIMDTADQPTGYGSAAWRGHRPRCDAACVALARRAGAVILGKTVTTEFAARQPGRTVNPHNAAHTPGGSSSGSAAGVADFMMPLAFGTQTAGSVIRPASYCGVVGMKPSFGTIAIAGTKPYAPSLDTIGGFARSVADLALFIAALSGRAALIPAAPARKPRIGLYRQEGFDQAEPATLAAIDSAAERLSRAGAELAERPHFQVFDGLLAAQLTIIGYEGARNLAWEEANCADALGPLTRSMIAEGNAITAEAYDAALERGEAARHSAGHFFGDFDAMLVPAAPGEAPHGIASTGDPHFNRVWTLLRLPCITLPAKRGPNGLPVGVQLVGRPRGDAQLLAVALFAEGALDTKL